MRVLIVEDEPDLGAAIKRILNQEAYIVDWVLDGAQAWEYLESQWTKYTLVIFDWLLPELSGLELVRKLRSQNNSVPILMLTVKDTQADKVAGLDAGADDYLVKPFGTEEFLARLRALQRRSPQSQTQQFHLGSFTLNYSTNQVWIQDATEQQQVIPLTAKEFQLLEYMMRHPNQIVTRDQILDQLWEVGIEPTSNVVAAQMRLLRRKLAQFGCDHFLETVYGLGYRLTIKN